MGEKGLKHSESKLKAPLIFVGGKGGVGKTTISRSMAQGLAQRGKRTLWVTINDPTPEKLEAKKVSDHLYHLNCKPMASFQEYVGLKLRTATVAKFFLSNKVIRSLVAVSPGVYELVILGKIWWERKNYDHIVVDLPSSGYGMTMFQSVKNFHQLTRVGPVYQDTDEMLRTFADPNWTQFFIAALPEEMPLQEGLELGEFMMELFPDNPPSYFVNRCFPKLNNLPQEFTPSGSATRYVLNRSELEEHNLRLWREADLSFAQIGYFPSRSENASQEYSDYIHSELDREGFYE